MTNTKYYNEYVSKGRRSTDPNKGKVVIDADAYHEDTVREWKCPWCDHTLQAKRSRKEISCPNCTAELDLTGGRAQETKTLEDPNKGNAPNEVHAFTTNEPVNPWEKKPVQLKGAALAMSQKGIHFTSCVERGGSGKIISSELEEDDAY